MDEDNSFLCWLRTMLGAVAGLTYAVCPADIVNDLIPLFGQLDDILVILVAMGYSVKQFICGFASLINACKQLVSVFFAIIKKRYN